MPSGMKTFFGFLLGLLVGGVFLFGAQVAIPSRADSDSLDISENTSLVQLLPDFKKFYRQALLMPLHEAEKEIYDEDIASFYHSLLERSSLDYPSNQMN